MAKVLYSITACLKKTDTMEKHSSEASKNMNDDEDNATKENAVSQAGLISKVSSGIFSIGSSAVGLGVGGVKWAATTTLNVGSGVLGVSKNVVSKVGLTTIKQKPKNE